MPKLMPLLAILHVGCVADLDLQPNTARDISCDSDDDCPGSLVCVQSAGFCRDPTSACIDQTASGFVAVPPGTSCLLADQSQGVCNNGGCVTSECGDAIVDTNGGESCDLGSDVNSSAGNALCRPDCTSQRCGDGILDTDSSEECDGADLGGNACTTRGYYSGSLSCAVTCTFDESSCSGTCGDGTINGPELCDGGDFGPDTCQAHGFYGGTLACTNCTTVDVSSRTGYCGDGVLDTGEECDGTAHNGLTCRDESFRLTGGALQCDGSCKLRADNYSDTGGPSHGTTAGCARTPLLPTVVFRCSETMPRGRKTFRTTRRSRCAMMRDAKFTIG